MRLIDALRVNSSSKISLVGSGGKTSALIRLMTEWPSISISASTAHIGRDQATLFPRHVVWTPNQQVEETIEVSTLITGQNDQKTKLCGIDPSLWGKLKDTANKHKVPLFFESDGSKTRSVKAPADHEPVIPPWVNHVVVSIGLSAIGKPLNAENVHRPEIFSKLSGLEFGEPVSLHSIGNLLTHPLGGLKNIPHSARRTVLLNQLDTLKDKSGLPELETRLLDHYHTVIVAVLNGNMGGDVLDYFENEVVRVSEKTAGIILAAGTSKRMEQPKAFLEWNGMPFIRNCALSAVSAGLDPVIVVAGQEINKISEIVQDLPVQVIENPEYQEGQSTSIRAGIKSLPKHTGRVIFLLVDQPQIPVTIIRKLISEHSTSLSPIILPESGGRRGNPVLFDRATFQALMEIQGDVGGRVIFSRFRVHKVPWYDESILLDVDTPDDYERLLEFHH